jgi:pimeloyl-ACP methyl ester carboxylesterase
MNRRRFVIAQGAALAGLAGGIRAASREEQHMETPVFVLVHGAWHGGWCWRWLAPLLREQGYEVYAPTLTGLGERSHLLAPEIDLTTHIDDVVGVLQYEDLANVVLVGHSYAGMVVSGVVERSPERIAHAIYLDAFLPHHGESIRDLGAPDLDDIAAAYGDGWRMPPPGDAAGFGVTDPDDRAWVDARLGDQPYATFTQAVSLTRDDSDGIARSFILTSQFLFPDHAARARERRFEVRELMAAGHDSMITMPRELAALLRELVEVGEATHAS